mmetsp:Transcript_3557/g.7336  ORF Transcript_3557/g.7336 Transcript_3557/m.7336 type:complete len:121 (+) Transcript_3557:480-842(+)
MATAEVFAGEEETAEERAAGMAVLLLNCSVLASAPPCSDLHSPPAHLPPRLRLTGVLSCSSSGRIGGGWRGGCPANRQAVSREQLLASQRPELPERVARSTFLLACPCPRRAAAVCPRDG